MSKNITLYGLLKNKNFLFFVIYRTLCISCSNILQFALALYSLNLTGSAFIFSTVLSIMIVPRLLFTPIAGVVGDHFSRKKLLTFIAIFLGSFLFFWSLVLNHAFRGLWCIYLIVIGLELFEIFFSASSNTIVPSLFQGKALGLANSLMELLDNVTEILVPLLAGMLFSMLQINWLLFILGVFFLISGIFSTSLVLPRVTEDVQKQSFKEELVAGMILVKNQPLLFSLILIAPLINFAIAPVFDITLMYLLNNIYEINSTFIGIILSLISFAGIISSLLLTKFFPSKNILSLCKYLSVLVSSFFLFLGCFFLTTPVIEIALIIILLSFAVIVSLVTILNVLTLTLVQSTTENRYLARVISILNLFATVSIPLGQLVYGFLIHRHSVSATFFLSSIVFFLIVGIISLKNLDKERQANEK